MSLFPTCAAGSRAPAGRSLPWRTSHALVIVTVAVTVHGVDDVLDEIGVGVAAIW